MAYQPFVQGQQVMASSQGVVIASNQTPVSIAGTVLVGNTLVASISGVAGASVLGTVPVTQSGAWSTSVVGTVSVIGTVSVVGTISINPASVSGSVGIVGNPSISGTVNVGNVVTVNSVYGNISGSVAAFQGGAWSASVLGSVAAYQSGTWNVFIAGSVASVGTPAANQSVSGTVGASIIGTVPVTQVGAWFISGSVATVGTVAANQSVSGTVGASIIGQLPAGTASLGSVATLQGTNPWIVASSIAGGIFPISGSVAATVTNTNLNVSGSVVAFIQGATIPPGSVSGTITANQGTNAGLGSRWPVIISNGTQSANVTAASMLSVTVDNIPSISGTVTVAGIPSIATTQQGTWNVSVAGAYATGAASVISGLGLLTFGVRNDTLASVLTAGDGRYSAMTVGAVGELMTAPAPITQWVIGVASCFTGVEQPVIAAQAAGVFTYVNSMQVTNQAGTAARVTFRSSAGGAVLANIIVPANGGFSFNIPTGLKTIAAGAFTASINAVASVYVNVQGFISKT